MANNNFYLSPSDIKKKYGIRTSTVYWWVRNNKITFAKIGKNVLIPETELLRFLESNTIRPIDEEDFIIPERIK